MMAAGYTPATSHTPQKLTESKGYKELLDEYGLNEKFITEALVDDIRSKPRKRFFELNLGAEILGMKKRSDGFDGQKPQPIIGVMVNVQINHSDQQNSGAPQTD